MERVLDGKSVRVNAEETKKMQLFYKKKAYVSMVDFCSVW